MTRLEIDPRYDGFAGVAFGGYVGGRLAVPLGGTAAVRFRRPTPTGRPLELDLVDGRARLHDGGTLLVEAEAWDGEIDVPPAPTLAEARVAARQYPGRRGHAQPGCFGCGPERSPEDGLRLAPGPVEDRPIVACPWVPPRWCGEGTVDVPVVWAALDCPSAWAHLVHAPMRGQQVTAAMAVRLDGEVRVGEQHVVFAWVIEADGDARVDGAAISDADGTVLAVARARWVARGAALRS